MVTVQDKKSAATSSADRSVKQATQQREESFTHFLARESQFFLEVMIVISLVMTILMMVSFFFFAFIPVSVLLICYGLLVLANAVERRTTPPPAQVESAPEAETEVAAVESETDRRFRRGWRIRSEDALRRRLTRVGIEVLVGAALMASVLAATVLPRSFIVLGVGVLFCYILFISAPVWLAWLNDETGAEERRQARMDGIGHRG